MCDPTGGVATAIIMGASAALGAGTAIYQGKVASANAKYQAQVADRNSAYAQRAANDAIERGDKEAIAKYQQVARIRSAQRNSFAAMGLDTSLGSPLDVANDTSILGAQDAHTILDNAGREATGYQIDAQNQRAEAASQRANASNASTGGLLGAAGSIASGAAQIAGYRADHRKPKSA